MPNKLKFEAKDKRVVDVLFSKYNKFRIPRYQRPYAWKEDEISEFWNDLIGSEDPYFIGSLIFNNEPLGETGYIDIIDGQQRLLTITIFSAVLRDNAKGIDIEVSNRYHRQDIAVEDRRGNESFRILPGDSTQKYFQKYIQEKNNNIIESDPNTKEELIIKKNYQYLYKKVSNELDKFDSNEKKLEFLDKLRDKVSGLIVIHIQIENEEEAYEIFETTNARGVDLSVSDLLKNLIFQKIPAKRDRDLAKDKWNEITNNVQATNTELKKFIRYYWISKHSFVTEKKLFKEIKREITDWNAFLEDLRNDSDWYNRLLEGSDDDFRDIKSGEKIYRSIFGIKLMDVSQCYVLLLSILRNHDSLGTDPTRIFQLIEKFTFQYSVVSKLPGNKVERIYSKFAIKIENILKNTPKKKISGKIQSIFAELEKELIDEKPSSILFKENFTELSYKNSTKSRMLIKYILNQIDSFYRKTGEERIDFANVNIEHILPLKPDEYWNLTKQEIKYYVNRLGNLTIIDKKINSKVQNRVIKEKIEEYKSSRLPITEELVKTLKNLDYKWDEKQISRRQEEFANLAYNEIWNF